MAQNSATHVQMAHAGVVPDVVAVCLKRLDLIHGVVVVHAQLQIISTAHDPLLACHKLGGAHYSMSAAVAAAVAAAAAAVAAKRKSPQQRASFSCWTAFTVL
jgi:hypothetical protein